MGAGSTLPFARLDAGAVAAQPIAAMLLRTGRLLWRGATVA